MSKSRTVIQIERLALIIMSSVLAINSASAYSNEEFIVLTLMASMWLFVVAVAVASA